MRTKKSISYLKIVSPDSIDQKYNIIIPAMTCEQSMEPSDKHTRISDLPKATRDDQMHFSFLDESKKDHQCVVTMKTYLTEEKMPTNTPVHCFWCRHSFNYRPVGCPIDYVPHRVTKTYYSEITKDDYVLRENMTNKQLDHLKDDVQNGTLARCKFNYQERDYYLMDGLFCSFNCTLAFIQNQIGTNPLYMQSESFLKKIYYEVFGDNALPLVAAPSWRLLKDYGGHMTIDEFRKNFYKIEYNDVNNIVVPFPNSKPIGILFEEQIKL